jgi:hypothetical protein
LAAATRPNRGGAIRDQLSTKDLSAEPAVDVVGGARRLAEHDERQGKNLTSKLSYLGTLGSVKVFCATHPSSDTLDQIYQG